MIIEGEVKEETGFGWPYGDEWKPDQNEKDQALKEDLGSMLRGGGFTDFEIVTESKTFKVHKAMLASRSTVFAAMLQAPMVEEKTGSVNVKDFGTDVVEAMLEHVNTAHVENIEDKARALLPIADKYDLQGLKEACEIVIAKTVTVETSADDLVLADLVNAKNLKSKVIAFINQNKESVKKTEDFLRLSQSTNAALVAKVYLAQ